MKYRQGTVLCLALVGLSLGAACLPAAEAATASATGWQWAGWGGGGLFWAAAFHPTKDGTIYMGGDCAGVYKSVDHGKQWRMINNGLANYGVYSLAVDRQSPETVYTGTVGGLCKSTDGGEHWQFLPRTGPKDLHITAERNHSTGAIAVDPSDSRIVYAASPGGKVYKSCDGGQTWTSVYQVATASEDPNVLRIQFGKTNGDAFGGFWFPLAPPADFKAEACTGFGFPFRSESKVPPAQVFLQLQTSAGITYRSANLRRLFETDAQQDVLLKAEDLAVDPEFAKKNPEKAKAAPPHPDWPKVNRMDICCVGSLADHASVGLFGSFYFQMGGPSRVLASRTRVTLKDVAQDKLCHPYGNVRFGSPRAGGVRCVAVSERHPAVVLAATESAGVVLSADAGQTWRPLPTPKSATSVAVAATDERVFYGTFGADGIWKSSDQGDTWARCAQGIASNAILVRVVVSATNALDVYAIAGTGWNGTFYASHDGGQSWSAVRSLAADYAADPTTDGNFPPRVAMSKLTDLAISPVNPNELYIAANWRPCVSTDAGKSFVESDRGADISCIHDIRFYHGRVYACAMDEGSFVSADDGASWRQLWPRKFSREFSGHNWRLSISGTGDVDRILSTCTPWEAALPNQVIISEDGGKTFKAAKAGLPTYRPKPNTMWGEGLARALAVDPRDPKVMYLGIDGDPTPGKSGGGIFKSTDGGYTWVQLAHQPGSRRMFYGLAVDPTDSRRLYWGACGTGGGVYRSEDGGETWQHVFKDESFVFNLLVAADGTVYCPGKNLWRSTDHGATWKKITPFTADRAIVGLEVHPRDPKTIWISAVTWDGSSNGAVYKTSDDGATWQDITGDLPYRKPLVLRFNPATDELWAGGVCLFKLKQ